MQARRWRGASGTTRNITAPNHPRQFHASVARDSSKRRHLTTGSIWSRTSKNLIDTGLELNYYVRVRCSHDSFNPLDDPKTWEGIGESYEAAPPTPENAQVTIDDKQGWVYDPDAQITIVRLRAELAALQAARDSAYLAKEIGVVEHFKGSWHDDCRCDPCIAVREIAQAAVAETIEMCASVADRYKFMPVDMIASQGVARAIRALSPATIQKGKP